MKRIMTVVSILLTVIMLCAGCSNPIGKFKECSAVYNINELADMFDSNKFLAENFGKKYFGQQVRITGMVLNRASAYGFRNLSTIIRTDYDLIVLCGSSREGNLVFAEYIVPRDLGKKLNIGFGDILKIQGTLESVDEFKGCKIISFIGDVNRNIQTLDRFNSERVRASYISGIEVIRSEDYIFSAKNLSMLLKDAYLHSEISKLSKFKQRVISVKGMLAMADSEFGETIKIDNVECTRISLFGSDMTEIVAVVRTDELQKILKKVNYKGMADTLLNGGELPELIIKGKVNDIVKGSGLVLSPQFGYSLLMHPKGNLSQMRLEDIAQIKLSDKQVSRILK